MAWEEMTRRTCRELGGFEPDIHHRTNDATVSLALVARGLAVALSRASRSRGTIPDVVLRDTGVTRRILAVIRAADAAPSIRPGAAHPDARVSTLRTLCVSSSLA